MSDQPPFHVEPDKQALRDAWLAAENVRVEAYRAFMEANRNSPLRQELTAAEEKERRAKEAYSRALRGETNESTEL